MSCIKRWLQQRKNQGKCPQCNRKCTQKDVRKLFASRLVAVDEESQKRIRLLETKCASLEKKKADWSKKEAKWRKIEAEMRLKFQQLKERTAYLEQKIEDFSQGPSRLASAGRDFQRKSVTGNDSGTSLVQCFADKDPLPVLCYRFDVSCSLICYFLCNKELQVDGAHLFDVDASNQILLIARTLSGRGTKHILTKISLIPPHEREDILLPPTINFIKDLHISPSDSSLALFCSLRKDLSLFSTESNNVILAYDLPFSAWTCSWDLNSSNYMYAGLQNGSVLMFDMRQTKGPVKYLKGLTTNPVHTVHSLLHKSTLPSGVRSVLSASSAGLFQWNFEGVDEMPTLIPETEKQGVCISLAYCPSTDDIVASYRPKVETHNEVAISQPSQTPPNLIGQGIMGSHVQYKRAGSNSFQKLASTYASVNQIRLPKCAIIDLEEDKKLFSSREEGACELTLQELPSFSVFQRLNSKGHPLRDIKYTNALGQGLLGCLSGDMLQIFST
ncbi:Zinc finger, RING/FYVE/PHD-type domain containing protein [Trema orientale]|uniref:Zinc finger, RING/FYVE/PHD-type domain containing protein n=1 Tax=Trema orientale TaxID=63057 RepID=A0A2P5FVD1_TREOI|nr:Zinc finger, RING/FYVE/PHD-type domain containing protein [Trema orientale]